ncbi:MAG: carbon dioxide concentrating mechanism protein [Oscillatoriaceae bacterium SKW80]|nr:carbon dioxide concentrating mechanism protein [Oscillatoriaceae bacterium SKYG93]MCX8119590.1 carbon dioxide concentrating mechanism protein [Oscillatoriaceae bacterium SKW80]MDW8455057.1 carbon dioxide concentrating mechanism protein [Oscillatoriaceae cyanobacterium SKYGB_i_bin93]HIK28166.1 carbon dioxide concentrating mechanism protein [Oscillatoriaceae cyanobacterium M7585_C2015_266]
MLMPLLRSVELSQYYVSGDVTIDKSAAIAPGVILHADPGSRIVISAGVCIGMGAILHARNGTLTVEAGAILGAGVLIVGKAKIGANACVGAVTTIINSDIAPQQVVSPASLVGDTSRQVTQTASSAASTEASTSELWAEEAESVAGASTEPPSPTAPPEEPPNTPKADENSLQQSQQSSVSFQTIAYSQRHLNRLMLTLFPNGQYFRSAGQNGQG